MEKKHKLLIWHTDILLSLNGDMSEEWEVIRSDESFSEMDSWLQNTENGLAPSSMITNIPLQVEWVYVKR